MPLIRPSCRIYVLICTLNGNPYSILFQRGVYPADDFHMVKKYGQTVLVTQDLSLENYLEK